MAFSSYSAGKLLDHFFGKATFVPPTNYYIGLSKASTYSPVQEVSQPDYARLSSAPADWDVANLTGNPFISNLTEFTFPAAESSWGLIKEVVLFDALTEGEILGRAFLSTNKSVYTDDILLILPGKLQFILI